MWAHVHRSTHQIPHTKTGMIYGISKEFWSFSLEWNGIHLYCVFFKFFCTILLSAKYFVFTHLSTSPDEHGNIYKISHTHSCTCHNKGSFSFTCRIMLKTQKMIGSGIYFHYMMFFTKRANTHSHRSVRERERERRTWGDSEPFIKVSAFVKNLHSSISELNEISFISQLNLI